MAKVIMVNTVGYDVPCFPECPSSFIEDDTLPSSDEFAQCRHPCNTSGFKYCSTMHMGKPYIKNWTHVAHCPMDGKSDDEQSA